MHAAMTTGGDNRAGRVGARVPGVALYALASLGAHVSYAPLLALLLPRRIVAIAPDRATATASLVVLIGAVVASLAHILGGRISDVWRRGHGNRRAPIALGLALTVIALAGLGFARSVLAAAAGLIALQLSLNLMMAPIGALLVDHFDDGDKGRVAALVNLAAPLAGLGTGLVALVFPLDGLAGFFAVAGLVAVCVVPLVVVWPFSPIVAGGSADAPSPPVLRRATAPADLVRVGLARMLMQSGNAFMMGYFYLYLVRHPARAGIAAGRSVDPVYGRLVVATTLAVLIATVLTGNWSDRHRRRRAPMIVAALTGALALALVQAGGPALVLAGYGLFQVGLIAYLALDTAVVAQILDRSARPGEVLGYMNLANTLPSIVVPAIVLALSGGAGEAPWTPGFAGTAVCCLLAAALVARMRAVA
jgi:MFS family permease